MKGKIKNSWIAGLVAAAMASLCCILPMFAIIGGVGGSSATYFSWAEPYRPYIIALTIVLFGLAWYNMLQKKAIKKAECGCEEEAKGFMNSKGFLLIVTVISGLLITFPYYSDLLYAKPVAAVTVGQSQKRLATARLSIQGMSCAGCTSHIDGGLKGISGISRSMTSFEKAMTEVSYDPDSISTDSISKKIRQIGYRNNIIN
ncbi:mercuric transport protein MerTP [Pedobacter sp. Du54]|uniref:mercuric transport protein MerTP n=1 Tax=Pedobacter anseongensis TaxID=3133439 RepID=UPI0030A54DCA